MRIDELTLDPNFLPEYANAILSLERSKLIEYLRSKGLDFLLLPYKDATEASMNAARTQGWQMCLDAIEEFKKTLGSQKDLKAEMPRADFGSLERAAAFGDLSEEEKEALANGKLPDYSEFTKPVANARSTAVNPAKR